MPRLSWWLPDGARHQLGYSIRADNGWDTGRVDSDRSVLVGYTGPALQSAERVSWRVKVWTDLGESGWSEEHVFELGLLGTEDWTARWIVPLESERLPPGGRPAMLVRYEFELDRSIARARLYATAHGIYEAFVNGQRVGDAELTPGFTKYRDRLQVQTFDIAGLLAPGANAVGAILSDGWFRGQVGLPRAHDQWGSELGFLAEVRAEFADGSSAVIGTGEGWRSARSHIEAADLIAGESIDLRERLDGWSEPGFDGSLPVRRRGVLHEVVTGPGRRAVVERTRRQPGAEPAVGVRGRLRGRDERFGRLGRRRRDRPVGDLPRLR